MSRAEVALLVLFFCSLPSGCSGAGGESPQGSIVLITLDTTSADAVDLSGADSDVTPALAAFSQECVVYDRARTCVPVTLPAHASILTGLYPVRHTVRDNAHLPLPDSAETLAERARGAGYRTAAFLAAQVLAPSFGLDQGFRVYDCPDPSQDSSQGPGAEHASSRRGREVTERAIAWLDDRMGQEPIFLWAHYFDPHTPYEPEPAFASRGGGDPYLGEVAAMDAAVGELLDRLRREEDYEQMTIVVVSDHGEARGKGGERTHGLLLHDATLRVPMMVRFPGGRDAGRRSIAMVSVVDVFPTVVAAAGLGESAQLDGLDLAHLDRLGERGVYVENYHGYMNYGWSHICGWVDDRGLYVHGPQPALLDPDGQQLPSEERERARAEALQAIAGVVARYSLPPAPGASRPSVDLTHLGYAGSGGSEMELPEPLELLPGRPAPRERVAEHDEMWDALADAEEGDLDSAIARLQALAEGNPRNASVREYLAEFLVRARRPHEALVPLREMLEHGYERPSVRRQLAMIYAMLGEFEKAMAELERFEALAPHDTRGRVFRGQLERAMRGQLPGQGRR